MFVYGEEVPIIVVSSVLVEEIKETQDQKESFQKKADLLCEKIRKIDREIELREEGIGKIDNFRRRKIMKGILEDKKILKEQFELELKELKKKL